MVEVPEGQLFLDGCDLTHLKLQDLREQIALVPQEGYLFTSSLADNLRFGDPEASMDRVEAAADQARLLADVKGFPTVLKRWWEREESHSAGGNGNEPPLAEPF